MRVAIANEISCATRAGNNDDGDHKLKAVANATATRITNPIYCNARMSGEAEGDNINEK